jgi:hypothetical protein
MSKKALDVQAITNELEGASLFFTKPANSPTSVSDTAYHSPPRPVAQKTEPRVPKTSETDQIQPTEIPEVSKEKTNDRTTEVSKERKTDRSNGESNVRTNERPVERPKKRQTERHTFDIYTDQLLALKEITLSRERITGEKVLIGDLAKEAMDLLITKEKIK